MQCPIQDHRGNAKGKQLIRKINERLRTNKRIVLNKDNSGLLELLYAFRITLEKITNQRQNYKITENSLQ